MSVVNNQTARNLPDGYDDNRIILMAGNPHLLYAYWDMDRSRLDRLIGEYGQELWDRSSPVLKVTNHSSNAFFYVRINEFSQSWYIHIQETSGQYSTELGRKLPDGRFISLLQSNVICAPHESMSNNTQAFFIDIRKKTRLTGVWRKRQFSFQDLEPASCEALQDEGQTKEILESIGLSSARINEKDLLELLGLSSDSVMKG